jgi:hypothetical protein
MPRRSPCLALRASSVETLRHRTWGSKKIEKAAAPVALRIRRCCKLSRRSPCLALRASSVETLRHRTWSSKNIERRLAAPVGRCLETLLRSAPAFPLSGLACFLSGDLAPQDLRNSKKIEKAAALSPNVVDYLLLVLTKSKVGMIFPLHTSLFLPSFTRIVVILLLGFRVAENGKPRPRNNAFERQPLTRATYN